MTTRSVRSRIVGLVVLAALAATARAQRAEEARAEAERLFEAAVEQAGLRTEPGNARALELFERSLPLWTAAGELAEQARTCNQMAMIRRRIGETASAVELYGKALELFRRAGDRVGEANVLNNRGRALAELDEAGLARRDYETALALWREMDDPRQAATLRNLGQLLLWQEEYAAAIERFREALELSRKEGDAFGEGSSFNSMGQGQLSLGELATAESSFRAALELARAAERIDLRAAALSNLGHVHRQQGDLGIALGSFLEALDLFRQVGEPLHVAEALQNLGTVYGELGQSRRALDVYAEALELFRGVGRQSAAALVALSASWVRIQRGEVAEAVADLERLLAERRAAGDRKIEAEVLDTLGFAHLAAGRPLDARDVLEKALERWREIGDPSRRANALANLGRAYAALGNADRAQASFQAARELGHDHNPGAEATSLDGLARLERDRGRFEDARDLAERAVALAESRRDLVPTPELRATFLAQQRTYYELYLDLLIRLHERDPDRGFDAAAFEASERARARGLLDLLAERGGESKIGEPIRLGEVRQLLAPATALVEYVLGDDGVLLFVVTRGAVRSFRLGASPPRIAARVEELRAALAGGGRRRLGAYRSAAWSLYRTLVEPAAASLEGVERLVIVPDGSLHYLPFEALLTAPPEAGPATDGTWPHLLTRWSVSYAPSASVLASLARAETGRRPAAGPAFLAFADPSYGDGPGALPRLAGSAREVAGIAALYPPSEVTLYLGPEAREENVKANELVRRARRLHFATHGLLDERRPQLSALALARHDDPAEDGLFQVHEIARLDLAAELVVLSACGTALGEEVRGEGLTGLARAFLYAGAPRVVVSLWRVDDEATADLMVRFYRALGRGGAAEALHAAKLELLREGRFAHPAHWASFVLIGRP